MTIAHKYNKHEKERVGNFFYEIDLTVQKKLAEKHDLSNYVLILTSSS